MLEGLIAQIFKISLDKIIEIDSKPDYERQPDAPTFKQNPQSVRPLPDLLNKYDGVLSQD